MTGDRPTEVIETILRRFPTITVVGASADPMKPAHYVPAHMAQHGWRIVPVNPRGGTILGSEAFPTLADVPENIPGAGEFVNVFRPSAQTPDVARQAAASGAKALWLQLGIGSEEARQIAADAGMLYVEDRCLLVEQRRLGIDAA
jgi:uncharacterized protein